MEMGSLHISWTEVPLLFPVLVPRPAAVHPAGSLPGHVEECLKENRLSAFQLISCKTHRGGQMLQENCPMGYEPAALFLISVSPLAPGSMNTLIRSHVETKHKPSGEGAWPGSCPSRKMAPSLLQNVEYCFAPSVHSLCGCRFTFR